MMFCVGSRAESNGARLDCFNRIRPGIAGPACSLLSIDSMIRLLVVRDLCIPLRCHVASQFGRGHLSLRFGRFLRRFAKKIEAKCSEKRFRVQIVDRSRIDRRWLVESSDQWWKR